MVRSGPSIARPERPKDEIGSISHWEQREPVDATVLADPVPNLHVIGMSFLRKSGGFGLFSSEEALRLFGDLDEPPRCFSMRLGHYTVLQLSCVNSIATRR